jgi:hypothetical protein
MSHPSTPSELSDRPEPETTPLIESDPGEAPKSPQDSYVKLAMRNMVRKRGTSLQHFFLTTAGLLGLLVGLAYLTR